MLMLLSLRMMSMSLGVVDTLLSPSKASPPLMAPSPIIATTCLLPLPVFFAASAIPSAAEIELEACPQTKLSYSLSNGDGKGIIPFSLRLVQKRSFLPVRILCP